MTTISDFKLRKSSYPSLIVKIANIELKTDQADLYLKTIIEQCWFQMEHSSNSGKGGIADKITQYYDASGRPSSGHNYL